MSNLASRLSGRVTLDLDRLVTEGSLSSDEAERLRALALPAQTNRILANVLLIFGALMLVAGVLTLRPAIDVGVGMAVGALLVGGLLIRLARHEWGLLGQTLVLMGVLGLGGWAALRFDGLGQPWPHLVAPFIASITIVGALASRNRVLAALSPTAVGGVIGAGTGYWHAAYALYISEATICVVLFTALAAVLYWSRPRWPAMLQESTLVAARVSFILANLGFWIGSLWGDYPGEMWFTSETVWSHDAAWRATAFHVADVAFSVGWAAFLVGALYIGLKTHRRFVANSAIVFLAIHLYTQFFERFYLHAEAAVAGGAGLIVLGIALFRFDRWQRERAVVTAA